MILVATASLSTGSSAQTPRYDLLLKGGHVIDPGTTWTR